MEMQKSYYLVAYKPAYHELARVQSTADVDDLAPQRTVVAVTQGGFGQDVVDDERQVKEKFIEYLFYTSGIDLPRSVDAFDQYFELEPLNEVIDLDDEV